ncbi:MAG TPA: tetratricopeptide repeat protein [Anaerolineales bacterium]|nr:tetratricopeptide repeat protein [Anaerolineales bacterium]
MGSDLKERFRRAGLEAQGQRRNVTVLFADLSDYTGLAERMDSEDLYLLVKQFVESLVEVVYKYEGMVDKIIGDGLMALFGAPMAHENNAERAVRTALEMQSHIAILSEKQIGRLNEQLKLHIGLHSGMVIVGGVGSDMLMDYTAIGDTVNLARRLEEAAPAGTILVSDKVYRRTRAIFEYRKLPALSLKGVSKPVTGYRLVGQKSRPGSVRGLEGLRAPLIGRDAELDFLKQAFYDLNNLQQGKFVLVTGDAGIGKSRLTSELKRQVNHMPFKMLEGQSLTYRRSVPYWIFQDLMRHYLGVTPETSSLKIHEKLVGKAYDILGSQAADHLPYLEHMLSLEYADKTAAERLAYLDASQLRQQIFIAVRELLANETQQHPLVLILEDLHWADDASLDLLAYLVDSVRQLPLLIYAISRPFQDGKMGEIVDHAKTFLGDQFAHIQLGALSPEQSERLFFQLLSIPELPEELSQRVLQRASGVPFYLEEILRMLIDAQIIQREQQHWRLAPGADVSAMGVPDTLRDLILARFDRLEPYYRSVLQAASVIGKEFGLPLLRELVPSSDDFQLRQVLSRLTEREFVFPRDSFPESEYAFRHVLTSDAVYSTLLRQDRGELHGRAGEAIERLYADQIDTQVEVLAAHFLRSSRLDRALHYLILSAERAARDYANEQARHHYREALNLLPEVSHSADQSLRVHVGLGDVLLFVGDYLAAREQYQQAVDVAGATGSLRDPHDGSLLQRKIAGTFERQGDYEKALLHLASANDLLESEPELKPVEAAQIANDIGWIHFLRGNFDEAQKFLTEALTLVEATSQYDVIASVHNRLGAVAYHQREYEKASAYVRRSLALRETIGDTAGVARLYNNLGLLGLMRGDLRDAEMNFLQGIELLEKIEDAEGIALAYTNLGLVQFDRGMLELAESNFRKSVLAAGQIGHRFYRGRALMYMGRLRTAQGQYGRADQLLIESISILEDLGAQDDLIDAAYYMGENYFAQGDLINATQWLDQAREIMKNEGESGLSLFVQRGRLLRLEGSMAGVRGDWRNAKRLLLESASIFHASYERLESAKTALELGFLARTQKKFLEARQYFQEARLIFKQLGAEISLQRAEQALKHLKG